MEQNLHAVKDYDGASGFITVRSDGATNKPTGFKIVKNGQFVPFVQ